MYSEVEYDEDWFLTIGFVNMLVTTFLARVYLLGCWDKIQTAVGSRGNKKMRSKFSECGKFFQSTFASSLFAFIPLVTLTRLNALNTICILKMHNFSPDISPYPQNYISKYFPDISIWISNRYCKYNVSKTESWTPHIPPKKLILL